MTSDTDNPQRQPSTAIRQGERVSYLENVKSFQDEMVKLIRIYTSNPSFSSERCLQEIVSFIARRFNISVVSILLMDDLSRELVLYVSAGEACPTAFVKNHRIALGEGLIGHSAVSGEVIVAADVKEEPRYVSGLLKNTRAELCVPIKIRSRIAGVLDLQDHKPGRFGDEFARLMDDIGLHVGFVCETKQLYDDLKRHNEELELKVQQKVQELKKTEERYRAIVENAADPIFMTDLEGRFIWINRAMCDSLGYPRDELEGMNATRIVKKGHVHKLYRAIRDVSEGRLVRSVNLEISTRSGEERTVELSCRPIRENGATSGVEGTFRDITDRVVIEKLKGNYLKSLEETVAERTKEIKETQRASILAIATLAESIDDDTGGHLERIRHYCRTLCEDMRLNSPYRDEIEENAAELLYDLSPLHDVGKVGIRDYILQKPDKLTPEEFERMKDHAEIGAQALHMAGEMIGHESIFSLAESIARYHHEKWDGSGYPAVEVGGEVRPLREAEIPLCARIVAVADVYDALTSKRPYKMPFPHDKAKEMIVAQSAKHFDPEVVNSFLRCEEGFLTIRKKFPDTQIPEGRPFQLPARDRT